MKIKLDENLPLRLATLLRDLGHNVHARAAERACEEGSASTVGTSEEES
jgi:hypothetical protein